jgi:hypothetical protein
VKNRKFSDGSQRHASAWAPLLPRNDLRTYAGKRPALYAFYLVTAFTIGRSLVHIIAPDGGAGSIASIPLAEFTSNGAAVVIHLFALWGLSQLLIGIFYLLAALRYRALIPLMYFLAIAEYLARLLIALAKPFETSATAPGAVGNYILPPLLFVMLLLSLRRGVRGPRSETPQA